MSFITDLETTLAADAKAVEGAIISAAEWLGHEIVADLEQFVSQFSSVAIQAVLDEAPKVISGSEKFGEAVTHVFQKAEAAGLAVVVQDAQMLVQAAYRQVQQIAQQKQP